MATLLTRKGKEIINNRLRGTGTEPLNLAWGTNPNALTAAATDVSLFLEPAGDSRTAGTSSIVSTGTPSPSNDTYQVTGTQTATAGRIIQEAALFDATTQPTTALVAAAGVVGSAVATTLNTSATFSPGNNNYIQIRNEVMQVTAGSGTTALTVVRGQNGSTAIATIAISDVVTPGNPPGQSGIAGGSMFAHADMAAINLANGDSITWTWKVQFT